MLSELISHQENMYRMVTERMQAISQIEKTAADIRKENVEIEKDALKLSAMDEGFRQLHEMRIQIDGETRFAKSARDHARTLVEWVTPLENGYGYSIQFPKHTWDAFAAILQLTTPTDRKAIRSIQLKPEQWSAGNYIVAATTTALGEWPFEVDGDPTLDQLLLWMMTPPLLYPKRGTPLHNLFVDEVFPKITAALEAREAEAEKRLATLYDVKMAAVKTMMEIAK